MNKEDAVVDTKKAMLKKGDKVSNGARNYTVAKRRRDGRTGIVEYKFIGMYNVWFGWIREPELEKTGYKKVD